MDINTEETEERGVRTPAVPLAAALDMLHQVRKLGLGKLARQQVAEALGYRSLNGRSNRMIAALIHYGLVDRAGTSGVRISDLGAKFLMPHDDEERASAVVEAAKHPALYAKLFSRYEDEVLTPRLSHALAREFGVHANVAEDAAKVFRETATFAGLLRNGVLYGTREVEQSSPSEDEDAPEDPSSPATPISTAPTPPRGLDARVPAGAQRYTIPLDVHGRTATIDIPVPVTPADLRRVKRWAEFVLAMEGESDEM